MGKLDMIFARTYFAAILALALSAQAALAQVTGEPEEAPIGSIPLTLDANAAAVAASINAFSLDLYRRTLEPQKNHFLSPVSVSVAVGLAYRGAAGQTATELASTMHFGVPPHDYLRQSAPLIASMDIVAPNCELRTGNAIWLQHNVPLRPDFEQDLARYPGAGLQRVDFKRDSEGAREQINAWVAQRTNDKIRNLLQPSEVKEDTRSILVNTIYWKGAWAREFAKAATRREPFATLAGPKTQTPLMHQRATFKVAQRGGVKAILLPYIGHDIEMAVFLPDSSKGLPRFEASLSMPVLARWFADLEASPGRETILTLPKMHLEWHEDLTDTLQAMGARSAFSDAADFSGMVPVPNAEDPDAIGFKISHVIHQTYLDVDEEGSEAAAATAVAHIVISSRRIGPPPPPPFVFQADKPFLFLLRDGRTGLILFMGRYVAPPTG